MQHVMPLGVGIHKAIKISTSLCPHIFKGAFFLIFKEYPYLACWMLKKKQQIWTSKSREILDCVTEVIFLFPSYMAILGGET